MFSRLASATAVVLTASSLANAQTYSSCNPLKQSGKPHFSTILIMSSYGI